MNIGKKGLELIKKYEGFYPKPYKDPIAIPTIGYEFTYYLPDRGKVTMQDRLPPQQSSKRMIVSVYSEAYRMMQRNNIGWGIAFLNVAIRVLWWFFRVMKK